MAKVHKPGGTTTPVTTTKSGKSAVPATKAAQRAPAARTTTKSVAKAPVKTVAKTVVKVVKSPAKAAPKPAAKPAAVAKRPAAGPASAASSAAKAPVKTAVAPAAKPAVKPAVQAVKSAPKPAAKAAPAKAAAGPAPAKAAAGPAPAKPAAPATPPAPKGIATRTTPEGRRVPADKFLAEQQDLLLFERASHLRQAEALKDEADALAQEMEFGESEFSEEGGEGGNMSIERELDLVLSAQAKAAVEEIERALAKIETGLYGKCEKCGKEIPRARLKVLPHAPLCVACKSGGLSRR